MNHPGNERAFFRTCGRIVFGRRGRIRMWGAAILAACVLGRAQEAAPPPAASALEPAANTQAERIRRIQELEGAAARAVQANDFETAGDTIEQIIGIVPAGHPMQGLLHVHLARFRIQSGRREAGLDALDTALRAGFSDVEAIEKDPVLSTLASEDRFRMAMDRTRRAREEQRKRMEAIPEGEGRLLLPKDSGPEGRLPLIVFLHGMGSTPDGLSRTLQPVADVLRCAVWIPCGSRKMGTPEKPLYNWDGRKDLDRVSDEARRVIIGKGLNSNEVYLLGVSAGGNMAYAVSLAHPDSFAGVVVFSGALQREFADPGKMRAVANRSPYYLVHGETDGVMPIRLAIEARDLLKECGMTVELYRFPGGHEFPPDMAGVIRRAIEWFRTQNPRP